MRLEFEFKIIFLDFSDMRIIEEELRINRLPAFKENEIML